MQILIFLCQSSACFSFFYQIFARFLVWMGFVLLLNACASSPREIPAYEPLRLPHDAVEIGIPSTTTEAQQAPNLSQPSVTRFGDVPMPATQAMQQQVVGDLERNAPPTFKSQHPIQLNLHDMPIPAFVNEVFGNLLGLNYQLAPDLKKQKDLVSVRIATPQPPAKLFESALAILEQYGITTYQQNSVLYFTASDKVDFREPPLLITGRTLPSVPSTHRTVFHVYPLQYIDPQEAQSWMEMLYKGEKDLKFSYNRSLNSIITRGNAQLVAETAKAIELLDQPFMHERYGMRITPRYVRADQLSNLLEKVLTAQGYKVGTQARSMTPILLLPLAEQNLLLVFTNQNALITHIRDWVESLDQPMPQDEQGTSLFYYRVQNTGAVDLAEILSRLLQDFKGTSSVASAPSEDSKGQEGKKNNLAGNSSIIVFEQDNALIFRITPTLWEQVRPLIQQMDTPARQVLIEVIIAEVTLTDEAEFGIEWLIRSAGVGGFSGTLGTRDINGNSGLGIGGSGLSYFPSNSSGQTLALLNAFAANNRVTILSTPRLMVRSGESATIDVGSEVPVITSQNTSPELQVGGSSTILQQIQYRRTGTLLEVKPVIHGNNRVDLEITQEISEAQLNKTSDISSPVILNRRIQTALSLQDGGSVLLGGLIATSRSQGESGVPLLKDIPLLGSLFRVNIESSTRTELMMLIIPYVLNNGDEAAEITRTLRQRLELVPVLRQDVPDTAPQLPEP